MSPREIRRELQDDFAKVQSANVNDPLFAQQWGLYSSLDADIDAPQAWGVYETEPTAGYGREPTVVAVLDSGVDYLHPDMAKNMWINNDEVLDECHDNIMNNDIGKHNVHHSTGLRQLSPVAFSCNPVKGGGSSSTRAVLARGCKCPSSSAGGSVGTSWQ